MPCPPPFIDCRSKSQSTSSRSRLRRRNRCDLGAQQQDEIRHLRRELSDLKKQIFGSLDAWQTVEVARHPDRPLTSDYLSLVFDEFVELHGDKNFGDDLAIRTGFAKLDQYKVLLVGQQKGKTLKERIACHFGAPIQKATERR